MIKMNYVTRIKKTTIIISMIALLPVRFIDDIAFAEQESSISSEESSEIATETNHDLNNMDATNTVDLTTSSEKSLDEDLVIQDTSSSEDEVESEKGESTEDNLSTNNSSVLKQENLTSIKEGLKKDSSYFLSILNSRGSTGKTLFSRIIEHTNSTDKPVQNGSHTFYRNSLPYTESSIWRSNVWIPEETSFESKGDYVFFKDYIARFDGDGQYKNCVSVGEKNYDVIGKLTISGIENFDKRDAELLDLLTDLTIGFNNEGMFFLGKRSERSFDELLINQGLSQYDVGKFPIAGNETINYHFLGTVQGESKCNEQIDIEIGGVSLTGMSMQLSAPYYVVNLEEGATNYDHVSLSETPIFVDGLDELYETGRLSIKNLIDKKLIPDKPSKLIEEHSTTISRVGTTYAKDEYKSATYKYKNWEGAPDKYLKTVMIKFELRDAVSQQPSYSANQTGSENLILLTDSKYKDNDAKETDLKTELSFIALKESGRQFKEYLENNPQDAKKNYEAPGTNQDIIGIQQSVSCFEQTSRKEVVSEVDAIYLEKNSIDQLVLSKPNALDKEPVVIYKTQKMMGNTPGEVVLEKVRLSMQKENKKAVADFKISETTKGIEIVPLSDRMKNLKKDEKLDVTYNLKVSTGEKKMVLTTGKVITKGKEYRTAERNLSFYNGGDLKPITVKYVYEDTKDKTLLPEEIIKTAVYYPGDGDSTLRLPVDLSSKHYQYSSNSLKLSNDGNELSLPFSDKEQALCVRYLGEPWIESIQNDLYFEGEIGVAKQKINNIGKQPLKVKIKSTELKQNWRLIGEASEFSAEGISVASESLNVLVDGKSLSQGGAVVHDTRGNTDNNETNIIIGSTDATPFDKRAFLVIEADNYKWAKANMNYQASIVWKINRNETDYTKVNQAIPKKVVKK